MEVHIGEQKKTENRHQGMKQVLMLCDSVTKGLRKDKRSTNSTTVDIKSHRGATAKSMQAAITDPRMQPKTI
jgi:hypothetical protein